jgi:nickel-dependent lactate racemase
MANVTFAFGKTGLALELPEGPEYEILQTRSASPLEDVEQSLAMALDHPIGRPPLREMAVGKKSAAISVCDITRPAPNSLTLPPVLERLEAGGIARDQITIFIATGLHRPATADEILTIVGPHVAANYCVQNHYAKDLASHAAVGTTRGGTPVFIEKGFVDADLHITLGFIEQHLMAGFSGGRKLIAPGLAAQETIKVLHSPKFMREPAAIEGSIDANPLHAELLEIAAMVRHDFVLDVALTKTREVAGVFAGDGVQAHAAGMRFVRETLLELLAEPVDAVITTAAGYPLDLTLYQTVKGITAAQHIVKPGGKILIISECAEGLGAPEFAAKLARLTTFEQFLKEIKDAPVEVDQWQLEKLALVGQKYDVLFYLPGIPRASAGALGAMMFDDPAAALQALIQDLPRGARVAVIPEGPYVFAQIGELALA